MSFTTDEVVQVAQEEKIPQPILTQLRTALEKLEREKKQEAADNKKPKTKNEFVVFVRGDF